MGIGDEMLDDLSDLGPIDLGEIDPINQGVVGGVVRDEGIEALPIVIIKNYGVKADKREVLDVLAEWAAGLADNRVRAGWIHNVVLLTSNISRLHTWLY